LSAAPQQWVWGKLCTEVEIANHATQNLVEKFLFVIPSNFYGGLRH